ncbi:hypothetical protein D3C75_760470 [compost metagenome]
MDVKAQRLEEPDQRQRRIQLEISEKGKVIFFRAFEAFLHVKGKQKDHDEEAQSHEDYNGSRFIPGKEGHADKSARHGDSAAGQKAFDNPHVVLQGRDVNGLQPYNDQLHVEHKQAQLVNGLQRRTVQEDCARRPPRKQTN